MVFMKNTNRSWLMISALVLGFHSALCLGDQGQRRPVVFKLSHSLLAHTADGKCSSVAGFNFT
jgi:hypothetical protein